eukprot:gene14813-14993_t
MHCFDLSGPPPQEIGRQVLQAAATAAANKLAAAAAAVEKLKGPELAEAVADLAAEPSEAPDALLSLQTGLRRCRVLLAAGADGLAKDKQLAKTCQ